MQACTNVGDMRYEPAYLDNKFKYNRLSSSLLLVKLFELKKTNNKSLMLYTLSCDDKKKVRLPACFRHVFFKDGIRYIGSTNCSCGSI